MQSMANSCLQYTKSSPERSPQAINLCEAAKLKAPPFSACVLTVLLLPSS